MILTTNTSYPLRKIQRIHACTHQRPQRKQVQYAVSRKGNTPYSSYMRIKYSGRYQAWPLLQETPIRRIQSRRYAVNLDNSTSNVLILLDSWTIGLLEYKLPLSSLRMKYGYCKNLKKTVETGQTWTRERKENTRARRMLSKDQVRLEPSCVLNGIASRWLINEPTGSITNWDGLKTKFLKKYCPPTRTAKKMEEINNFQQEPDENLYQAWERFKELLMQCPQHYLTEMQETTANAKVSIQEMAEYSQKWHNGTSRSRSTETSDGLAAIQAQMDNLGREINKVNEKVYAAQVGCEQCKGPHYTKDCPLKEEGKTLEEAYYTQFGRPFQGGGYRATAPGFYQRNNVNPSYQERMQSIEDTLSKFMSESAKRHEENSNLIKEIQASTDAAIRNQGTSIKTLEI
ncbi:pyruvate dehydrogenase (acetyl-transferring) kinase, mitochondrial [Tanacetum coccineum]